MSVKGTVIERERPQTAYRKLTGLNQSGLKLYDEDPIKFYKKYVLLEEVKEDSTTATLIGDLCDFYLLHCKRNEETFNQEFDEHFCLFNGTKSSAQVFTLCDELFEVAKRTIVDGTITGDFTLMFQEAFLTIQGKDKYKGKTWNQGLIDFNEKGKEYYNTLINSIGRKVVDMSLIDTCKRIANQLLTDDNVRWWFTGNDNIEALMKFPIEFNWSGFDCKAELDLLLIDHDSKTIHPADLKCSYDNEDFSYAYLKRKYYLQQAFYTIAVEMWAKTEGLGDYKISPMVFIVADTSANQRRPLIYKLNEMHVIEGLEGFTFNRRKYKGVEKIIQHIAWANEYSIWNISPDNHRNNSIVQLQTFNEE